MFDQALRLANEIAKQARDVRSIWLFGSRANGTFKATSDWDFWVFGTDVTLEMLRSATSLHRSGIDCFVVVNDDDFIAGWGDREKTGSLAAWQWKQVSGDEAAYEESKDADDGFSVKLAPRRAVLVWPSRA